MLCCLSSQSTTIDKIVIVSTALIMTTESIRTTGETISALLFYTAVVIIEKVTSDN